VVLLQFFCVIALGWVTVQKGLLHPEDGEAVGLDFIVGKIALPLLVFRAVATANMGHLNWSAVLACLLGKAVVFATTWIATYTLRGQGALQGERVVTATLFSYFVTASNDFALGFPVIEALYAKEEDMTVYLAVNATMFQLLVQPVAMLMLEAGSLMQASSATTTLKWTDFARKIIANPIILMTLFGIVYNRCFWDTLVAAGPGFRFPTPLDEILSLLTAPFVMGSLFLTGMVMRSAEPSVWAPFLVVMKVVACAFISKYFADMLLGNGPDLDRLKEFAFFYGSLPTSTAPLLLARQHDPSSANIIATGLLLGNLFSAPHMYIMSIFLGKSTDDMTQTLRSTCLFLGTCAVLCGAIFLASAAKTRQLWRYPQSIVLVYGGMAFAYAIATEWLMIDSRHCEPLVGNLRHPMLMLFSYFQNGCRFLVIYLQALLCLGFRNDWSSQGRVLPALFAFAILPAIFVKPNAVNEVCNLDLSLPGLRHTFEWSVLGLLVGLSLFVLGAIQRLRLDHDAPPKEPDMFPRLTIGILAVAQIARFLMQVVNCGSVMHGHKVTGVFTQQLIVEVVLEFGQPVFLLWGFLFDDAFLKQREDIWLSLQEALHLNPQKAAADEC
jgi:hypothetical protein